MLHHDYIIPATAMMVEHRDDNIGCAVTVFWSNWSKTFNHRFQRDLKPTRILVHLCCSGWDDAACSETDKGNVPIPEGWPDKEREINECALRVKG